MVLVGGTKVGFVDATLSSWSHYRVCYCLQNDPSSPARGPLDVPASLSARMDEAQNTQSAAMWEMWAGLQLLLFQRPAVSLRGTAHQGSTCSMGTTAPSARSWARWPHTHRVMSGDMFMVWASTPKVKVWVGCAGPRSPCILGRGFIFVPSEQTSQHGISALSTSKGI